MKIDNKIYFALVEEQLKAGKRVRITLAGRSMEPTLVAGDTLLLEPLGEKPMVGDVVLFRYESRHLLHRIVALEGDEVVTRGDNCASCERCLTGDVVARMVNVEKKSRLKHMAVRWLGPKGRCQLRPWYFVLLAFLMWAPLNGVGIPLDNYVLGLRMDHLLHASVFLPCVLMLWGWVKPGWKSWLCAVGIGLLTEFVQYLLPYRGFDINDMVANFLGVTLGWVAVIAMRRYRERSATR